MYKIRQYALYLKPWLIAVGRKIPNKWLINMDAIQVNWVDEVQENDEWCRMNVVR
jgi:hypothetical protein